MSSSVVVYSPDDIRGRIVSKILRVNGIKSLLFSSHFEVKEAIVRNSPPIVILDLKKNVPSELNFLETLSYKLSEATIIALADTSSVHVLENLGLTNLLCVSDPLDPELILSMVKDTLAGEFRVRTCLRILRKALSKFSKLVFRSIKIIILLIIGLLGGYMYWCVSTLPATENLDEYSPYESSKIFSYDNVLLSEFYVERRTFIPHEKIPKHVINAFIAVEDMRYYKHHGIDIIRTIGALFRNIKEGAFVQGGSTITQQLAKMLFLKPEKTISRKIKEIVLSLQIEKKYTKDEILGLYLNKAYFGARAYGIEAASQAYFGKSTEKIGISGAALLAALPKAPSKYSPFKNHEESLNRRNYVLRRMLVAGFINEMEYHEALSDPIPTKYHGRKHKAPYFVDYCKTDLEKKYGDRLYTSGLKIYTTLDYNEQLKAERAVRGGIEKLKKRGIEEVQAALLAVDLKTGRIRAMVGGTNFWDSQFNRVTQAMRQPGSAFKPIVYLTALKKGFRLDDTLEDQEVTYVLKGRDKTWTPRNHHEIYHGTVTLKKALALSLNAATVSLAKKVKIKSVIETAETIGIRSKIHPFYPSALGASELSLMELVYAFAAFARGNRIEPMCIDRIIDREKLALVEPSGVREKVIDDKVLANLKRMLRAVILNGTGIKARSLGRKVYGKTGTTNDYADAWFIGFDDEIVAGVWVGRDNRMPIGENETGSSAALPIWIEYMKN
jgi:penicillin-binding protein 1A